MKKLALYAALLLSMSAPAAAQIATPGLPLVPKGYCQLTSIDTATALSACSGGIPGGANAAIIEVDSQAIRYRDDGVNPTTTVGMPVASGTTFYYAGPLSLVRVISSTAGAKLNILFYKTP